MSTKERCGESIGLEAAMAFLRSPVCAYSRHERTPCLQHQVESRLGRSVACRLAKKQRAQRMRFGKHVLDGFDLAWSRDRAGHESNSNRFERLGRQSLRRKSCPKAVAIAGHRGKSGNPVVADEVVNLAALNVGTAVIAAAEPGIGRSRPGLGQARRQVLWVGSHVECSRGVAPDFPCGT